MSQSYQLKLTISNLLQTTWMQIKQLGLTEDEQDALQDSFDAILSKVNEKMIDIRPPDEIGTVDEDRKKKRKEKVDTEKEKKEPKEDKPDKPKSK